MKREREREEEARKKENAALYSPSSFSCLLSLCFTNLFIFPHFVFWFYYIELSLTDYKMLSTS